MAIEFGEFPSCHSLSINNGMSGVCAYIERIEGKYQVFGRKFTLESGWDTPQKIDSPAEFDAYNVHVKINMVGGKFSHL